MSPILTNGLALQALVVVMILSINSAGIYSVSVTDTNNCMVNTSIHVMSH